MLLAIFVMMRVTEFSRRAKNWAAVAPLINCENTTRYSSVCFFHDSRRSRQQPWNTLGSDRRNHISVCVPGHVLRTRNLSGSCMEVRHHRRRWPLNGPVRDHSDLLFCASGPRNGHAGGSELVCPRRKCLSV